MHVGDQGGYQNAVCFPRHVNILMKKIYQLANVNTQRPLWLEGKICLLCIDQ